MRTMRCLRAGYGGRGSTLMQARAVQSLLQRQVPCALFSSSAASLAAQFPHVFIHPTAKVCALDALS